MKIYQYVALFFYANIYKEPPNKNDQQVAKVKRLMIIKCLVYLQIRTLLI